MRYYYNYLRKLIKGECSLRRRERDLLGGVGGGGRRGRLWYFI